MDKYIIYQVQGYVKYTPVDDTYHEVVPIEVIATSEEEALKRAEEILKRPLYRIIGAYEKKI